MVPEPYVSVRLESLTYVPRTSRSGGAIEISREEECPRRDSRLWDTRCIVLSRLLKTSYEHVLGIGRDLSVGQFTCPICLSVIVSAFYSEYCIGGASSFQSRLSCNVAGQFSINSEFILDKDSVHNKKRPARSVCRIRHGSEMGGLADNIL